MSFVAPTQVSRPSLVGKVATNNNNTRYVLVNPSASGSSLLTINTTQASENKPLIVTAKSPSYSKSPMTFTAGISRKVVEGGGEVIRKILISREAQTEHVGSLDVHKPASK